MYNYILESIVISIIAALIFACINYLFIEKPRINKIRRKLDKDLGNIYSNINYLLHRLFVFPNPANNGLDWRGVDIEITKENIRLALLNKCINDTYKIYPQISSLQISWGYELAMNTNQLKKNIQNLFAFYGYLSAKEILILDEISELISKIHNPYKYNGIAPDGLIVLDTSMCYLNNILWDLYKCSNKLESYHNATQSKENIILNKIKQYINKGQYHKCKHEILKYNRQFPSNYIFLYLFENEYKNGNRTKAYEILEYYFKQNVDIVSGRSFYKFTSNDENVRILLNKYYDRSMIQNLYDAIDNDKSAVDEFFRQTNIIDLFIKQLFRKQNNSKI